ncbi:MAG: NACHT domain-containing protein, partial [Leptolyngbya sp. SIO3F4]|nr:NACHT domain-containing protein [Leptolyngbya sp. SIO3F4]
MGVGEFALGVILNLVSSLIYDSIEHSGENYFTKRRIKQRVENAVADVVEPLIPFLKQEGISEDQQCRLIQTCVDELKPLTETPEKLFQGSLDGQKIFDDLYSSSSYPQVIVEDGLQSVYSLLCPRIATLICKVPAAVKEWESQAWAENYRRLDEVTQQLTTIFSTVDNLVRAPKQSADEILNEVRRVLTQKVLFDLDLTGLRADSPISGRFDDLFVYPEIREIPLSNRDVKIAHKEDECFLFMTQPNFRGVLYGQAGSGKSTWTKWLQREAVISERWSGIAVRVELRKLLGCELPSIQTLIRETAGQHMSENLTAERISNWIHSRKIIFMLDGFDEIPPSERDRVITWIQDLGVAAQSCSLVISSRPLTTNQLDSLYAHRWNPWEIQPFDFPRIVDYIQRWYEYKPLAQDANQNVDSQALANEWQKEPTIQPLTGNPLLLSTLLMVHHLDGELPSGRSKLYQRYVDGMLGIWDQRRKVAATDIKLTQDQKRQILRNLALYLFLNEREEIDEISASEWLKKLLGSMRVKFSSEQVLANLRERSGLIIGPGVYSFVHKVLQSS